MKDIRIKAIAIFIASIIIFLGVVLYKIQIRLSLPMEPHPTQASSKVLLTSTFIPLPASALENFFGDSSCSWPCWQGITPGITTSSTAFNRLSNSHLVLKNSLQSEGSETEFGTAKWKWKLDEKWLSDTGKMEWQDGIVYDIQLNTYYHDVSLGEIINRFGPPEKIDVSDCTEIVEGPQKWCAVLYYNKNGFEVYIGWSRTGSEDIQITPSNIIKFIVLFKPTTIEDRLLHFGIEVQETNIQDWKGYGNLLDLYVP